MRMRDECTAKNREGCTLSRFFFFKQKTAYEIDCDWSSDVCSSDLSSHALPTPRLATASRSCRLKSRSSYTSASQMARLAAEHFWPLWPNAERTRSRTA